jgi:signal transduction histidine kinase
MLGVLDVTICLTAIDEQMRQSKIKRIGFAIISIICICGILGVFLKKLVTEPVGELVRATNRVSMGDFSYIIENPGNDELGQLAISFNNMTSKLSAMRMQLFQSDKMASLGRLSAGIAHELNNPLTGVLTYSSFLLKRASGDPELKKDLEVIVRETKRSREIVKGLLDFARQSVPKKSEVNINEIIDRTILVVKNQLKIQHIEIVKNIDPEIPEIRVDSNQIQQVFLNLVVNAIDSIDKQGGTITISSTVRSLSPRGIVMIHSAMCPNKHNLIDARHKIEGVPSIRVKTRYKGNVGFIHIDPLYGGLRHHYGIQLGKDASVDVHCPECDVSLIHVTKRCPECGAHIYVLHTADKGTIEGCARHGGTWQKWEVVDEEGKRKYIEATVTDTGAGIPQDQINDIFEPFFSTKGQVGTGLGLSVIWGIIDNHGGTISVDSTVGKGTSFTVRLPADSEHEAAPPRASNRSNS